MKTFFEQETKQAAFSVKRAEMRSKEKKEIDAAAELKVSTT